MSLISSCGYSTEYLLTTLDGRNRTDSVVPVFKKASLREETEKKLTINQKTPGHIQKGPVSSWKSRRSQQGFSRTVKPGGTWEGGAGIG